MQRFVCNWFPVRAKDSRDGNLVSYTTATDEIDVASSQGRTISPRNSEEST
jgi:hypothetical protein